MEQILNRLEPIEHWWRGNGKPGAAARIERLEEIQENQGDLLGCIESKVENLEKEDIKTGSAIERLVELAEEQKAYRIQREQDEKEARNKAVEQSWLKKNWLVTVLGLFVAFCTLAWPEIKDALQPKQDVKAIVSEILKEKEGK